jgi:hypothetical protein
MRDTNLLGFLDACKVMLEPMLVYAIAYAEPYTEGYDEAYNAFLLTAPWRSINAGHVSL